MTASTHTEFPADPKPVVNNVWAEATPAGLHEPVTLPSGQVVMAKKPDIADLARSGLLAERDKLSKLAGQQATGRAAEQGDAFDVFADNPTLLGDLDHTMCRLAVMVVVEPTVRLHWTGKGKDTALIPLKDRVPGVVYTDQIGLIDKTFLSEWAVGDLSAGFRGETGAPVAGVVHGQGVPGKGKRPRRPGGKRK